MWEEETDKITGNNKLFVRSITFSGNAVSAFPLNNILHFKSNVENVEMTSSFVYVLTLVV